MPRHTLTVSRVKEIDGTIGGILSIDQNVVSSDGRIVHVKAQFQVSPVHSPVTKQFR